MTLGFIAGVVFMGFVLVLVKLTEIAELLEAMQP
jgi:hypothetical protein